MLHLPFVAIYLNLANLKLDLASTTISCLLQISQLKVLILVTNLFFALEKKDALEAFLDPVNMMGLSLIKDELAKRQLERLEIEQHIVNMQNQMKDARNLIEVIDLGNKLVHKEY